MSKVIYAIGDIHGRLDLLKVIRKLIKADAKTHGFDDKTIIYLGDYVDRGPDSKGVIDLLMNKPLEGFNNICLKGNHEEIMFKAVEWSTRSTGMRTSWSSWPEMWMQNGGRRTLKSYGIDAYDLESGKIEWSDLINLIPKDHIYWMKSLPNYIIDGDYLFVHAGIFPEVPLEQQDPRVFLWIRDRFLDSTEDHGYRIIHGHSPTKGEVDIRSNRINLDTGSVWRGVQHALVIHDGQERYIKTPMFSMMSDKEQRA